MMNKKISQLSLTLSLGMAFTFSLVSPGLTQSVPSDNGSYQSNEKDSLYGDSTLGVNPMDLIHNYNLGVGRSSEEFNQESQTQIQDSAAEFRRLQQERMLQQYNSNPENIEETDTN